MRVSGAFLNDDRNQLTSSLDQITDLESSGLLLFTWTAAPLKTSHAFSFMSAALCAKAPHCNETQDDKRVISTRHTVSVVVQLRRCTSSFQYFHL